MKKRGWIVLALAAIVALCLVWPNYIKQGLEYLENEEYNKAISSFERQLEKGKNIEEAYRGMFLAYYEMEDYKNAISVCEKGQENGMSMEGTTYRILGDCYMQEESYEMALCVYDEGLKVENLSDETRKEMMRGCVIACEQMAKWEKAEEYMESYVKRYPEDKEALRELEFLQTR